MQTQQLRWSSRILNAQGNKTFPFKCKNAIKLRALSPALLFLFHGVLCGLLCAMSSSGSLARAQSGRKAGELRLRLTLAFTARATSEATLESRFLRVPFLWHFCM
jgi:hypothetical protein